ncbi:hypothetical protein QR98_0087720 [Sarcoptes scabiei]|uniref:Uncharacterized protein n=1 Tax=Sarcoptes scabiei TaxID=52283 RepID=A0A132AGV1_SARSC|nr:hypothetical protein QR98_0087720 [Sarcoptes scabiei]
MNENINILQDRQAFELDVCSKNIALFEKYIKDFEALRKRLTTLPDKTRHEIMVPIAGTKSALMPGYLYHTNEILVMIGDNYFVEKSYKETIEFIDRRIRFCEEKLKDLLHQQSMLNNWREATQQLNNDKGEFVDITEHCTEEEFTQWVLEHNEKVKKSKQKSSKTSREEKMELDKFFTKYKDDDSSVDKNNSFKSEIIQSDIVEKTDSFKAEGISKTASIKNRPISKFKAAKMIENEDCQ